MKKSVNHIAVNAMQVTGEYSHVPYPAKIEVKQAVTAAPSRSTQSRHAPRLIMQETHATLSREVFAEIPSYSSIQRMIQRRRNLNPIQMGLLAGHSKAFMSRMSFSDETWQLYVP